MANLDQPQGFRPKGMQARANVYVSAGVIYPGDCVSQEAGGRVAASAATSAICGVAIGYASAAGEDILVCDDPNQLFVCQADEADIDAQTDIGLNYDLLATAGSSAYRVSRMELDSSTGATTATLPLKLMGIEKRPDNALGAQVDCIVKINNHQLSASTGTAGV
jgi:hypothetical protein